MMAALEEFLQRLDGALGRGDGLGVERIDVADQLTAGVVLIECELGAGNAGIVRLDIDARGRARMIDDLANISDRHRPQAGRLLHRKLDAAFTRLRRGGLCGWRVRRRIGGRDRARTSKGEASREE